MPHVNARDITLKVVSRGNLDDLQAYRERMGWQFDWVSSQGTLVQPRLRRHHRPAEGERRVARASASSRSRTVLCTTPTPAGDRGCEIIDGAYHLIDLSPLGRQEEGRPRRARGGAATTSTRA